MNTDDAKRLKKIARYLLQISFVFIIGIEFLQIPLASCLDTSKLGESGKVTYVVDGDTFDVESVGRVRLADVNTPEMDTQAGVNAKTYVASLIDQKVVYLDIDDKYVTGYYGRYIAVAYVPYNSTHLVNLNQLLLKTGYAEKADYDNEFNPTIWENNPTEYVKNPSIPDTPENSDNPDNPDNSNDSSSNVIAGVIVLIVGILFLSGVFLFYADKNTSSRFIPKSPKKSVHPREKLTRPAILKTKRIINSEESPPSSRQTLLKTGKFGYLKQNVEGMLSWSLWKIVQVRGENKRVRNAPPTENFWKIWGKYKSSIKELGFSLSKYNERWQVSQWETL
ncbi:thermonuclease family protein [Promethearchaeum syntrophicum]|uniref:Thermonuclease family protein n=1 Tax=Promethearchaeum syntrophicum TaxID=2594042 RepID=A0A5B9DDH3_9ARCH|nr:thermonuclease family protein [Candidatus Prometheoarchaeum syntrophicum]QEE16803.1 hypothetical protein DSAG12_02633 [Candidatus Prometheoarchaeum syntrophicum]